MHAQTEITLYVSPVFPRIGVYGNEKNLPPRGPDTNLVNFLLPRASQQILHYQDFRDVYHLKTEACSVTMLGPISQDAIKTDH